MKIPNPSFNEEQLLWDQGYDFVAGIDEVGRGAFAGPVVTAAVVFPKSIFTNPHPLLTHITDSKLVPPKKRTELSEFITKSCLFSAISEIPVITINRLGIGRATFCAFRKVLSSVCDTFDPKKIYILSDGFPVPRVRLLGRDRQKAIIKGDRISRTIAAASIIAKVYRDTRMEQLHTKYLPYDFLRNKGYGTKDHREALYKHGLSKIHRTSFRLTKFLQVDPL